MHELKSTSPIQFSRNRIEYRPIIVGRVKGSVTKCHAKLRTRRRKSLLGCFKAREWTIPYQLADHLFTMHAISAPRLFKSNLEGNKSQKTRGESVFLVSSCRVISLGSWSPTAAPGGSCGGGGGSCGGGWQWTGRGLRRPPLQHKARDTSAISPLPSPVRRRHGSTPPPRECLDRVYGYERAGLDKIHL